MDRSKAVRRPSLLAYHSFVIASTLSVKASAYVGLRSGGWACCADASQEAHSHQHHPKHPDPRECLARHRRCRRQGETVGCLEATLQDEREALGGEETDPWEDAETRVRSSGRSRRDVLTYVANSKPACSYVVRTYTAAAADAAPHETEARPQLFPRLRVHPNHRRPSSERKP